MVCLAWLLLEVLNQGLAVPVLRLMRAVSAGAFLLTTSVLWNGVSEEFLQSFWNAGFLWQGCEWGSVFMTE